jgi:hypothetical protein
MFFGFFGKTVNCGGEDGAKAEKRKNIFSKTLVKTGKTHYSL